MKHILLTIIHKHSFICYQSWKSNTACSQNRFLTSSNWCLNPGGINPQWVHIISVFAGKFNTEKYIKTWKYTVLMLTRIKYVNASVTELRAGQGGGQQEGREEWKLHIKLKREV